MLIDFFLNLESHKPPGSIKDYPTLLETKAPLHGALLKNEQDVHLFERLVFMTRAQRT